jgi:mannosyltransferase OCH1-like enzyme
MIRKIIYNLIHFGFKQTIVKSKNRLLSILGIQQVKKNRKEFLKYIDEPIIDLLNMKRVFYYLKDNYFEKANNSNLYNKPLKLVQNQIIWICWLQGYENSPDIVKACFKSVKEHSSGYDVILITEENMSEYVHMPDYIMKKCNDGLITKTHFSDILRALLLITYGGIWLDATVFISGNIPEYIKNADLFMFKTSNLDKNAFLPASSWFIAAKKGNPILIKLYNILLKYWEKEKNMMHYYLFHISLALVVNYDQKANELWDKVLYKNNSDSHVLQFKLFDEYTNSMRDYIWQISFAHKLSHYFNYLEDYEYLQKKEGTFFQYIIRTLEE